MIRTSQNYKCSMVHQPMLFVYLEINVSKASPYNARTFDAKYSFVLMIFYIEIWMKVGRCLDHTTDTVTRWWWYFNRLHITISKATARGTSKWTIEMDNFILMNIPNFYIKWTSWAETIVCTTISIFNGPVHLYIFERKKMK